MSSPSSFRSTRTFRFAFLTLVCAWAAFWIWFVVAVSLGERPAPPWWIPIGACLVLVGLVVACFVRPRAGAVLLAATGAVCAAYFQNFWAATMLAGPALLLGAAGILFVKSPRVRG